MPAGDRFDFLNHGKVHQVPAMHTEEPVAVQTLLELSQAHRGEVAVRVGLQVCVTVARHDEANLIDADEDLLAALFHRNALGLLGLHMQRNVLADARSAWERRSVSTGFTR